MAFSYSFFSIRLIFGANGAIMAGYEQKENNELLIF